MKLASCGLTDAGRVHGVNEDFFLVDDESGLYVVSDGVGRYRGAALASRLVVEAASEKLRGDAPTSIVDRRLWLLEAVKHAARELAARAKKQRELASMSATLTLVKAVGEEMLLVHVGDSRAYRWRSGVLEQLTRDHSLAFEQYEAGAITKEALRTHPNQKLLTRTLRASSTLVIPDLSATPIEPGDRFLLCTDGLTKMLPDQRIGALLASSDEVGAIASGLVEAANEAGGEDNVTVIIMAAATLGR